MRTQCAVTVKAVNAGDVYRSYSFSDTGALQAFNSFGLGPSSKTTGARVYFLFPRGGTPSFRQLPSGELEIVTASGATAQFSTQNTRFLTLSGASILEDPEILPKNQGSFSILGSNTLYLDTGFAMGGSPYANRARSSTFHDPYGNACEVKNTEIFRYYGKGEAKLAFETDAALAEFLTSRCPGLDLSSLLPPEENPQSPAQPEASPLPEAPAAEEEEEVIIYSPEASRTWRVAPQPASEQPETE